jgi:hypothetical protein
VGTDYQVNSGDAMMLIVLAGIVMSLLSLRSEYLAWRSYVAHQKSNRLSLQKAYFERAKRGHVVTASPSIHSERAPRPMEQDATRSGAERFMLHRDRLRAQPSLIVNSCPLGACAASTYSPMDSVLSASPGWIHLNTNFCRLIRQGLIGYGRTPSQRAAPHRSLREQQRQLKPITKVLGTDPIGSIGPVAHTDL